MKVINDVIVGFVKLLPKSVVHIFAKKYIAGTTLEDAVRVVQELNNKGIVATMDVLGEAVNTKRESEEAMKECLMVLDAINKAIEITIVLLKYSLMMIYPNKICLL